MIRMRNASITDQNKPSHAAWLHDTAFEKKYDSLAGKEISKYFTKIIFKTFARNFWFTRIILECYHFSNAVKLLNQMSYNFLADFQI